MNIAELGLADRVVLPDDERYQQLTRTHAGRGAPAVVVVPESEADVQQAVRWARANDVPIYVHGGGRSEWGLLPGGMLLSLAAFTEVTVHAGRVRIGGGARWGQVARTLADHRLAISSGDTASVGVGGLTLGGGTRMRRPRTACTLSRRPNGCARSRIDGTRRTSSAALMCSYEKGAAPGWMRLLF